LTALVGAAGQGGELVPDTIASLLGGALASVRLWTQRELRDGGGQLTQQLVVG
jgi:hypothetical protein